MTKQKVYIGIDTSNYTTSIGVCDENGIVIANIKKLLDVKEGERGLRQSDAVFAHIKNFSLLATQLTDVIKDCDIQAIGVSTVPRDATGSYMPCFLAGKAVADMISSTHNVPVYQFSHQAGHIMAALYSSGNAENILKDNFVAFHVSGGTTEAVYVTPRNNSFDVNIIAETADISVGQAIDRAGVMMGLRFPCGKEIEQFAKLYTKKMPKAKICVKDGKCNLSGLENISQKLYNETKDISYVSAFVLNFVAETLAKLTYDIRTEHPYVPVLYAGGVMSNQFLQNKLSKFSNTYFATPEFSADNAAGIAILTYKSHKL